MDAKIDRDSARASLEKQLRHSTTPGERIPILLTLSKEPTRNDPEAAQRYAAEALNLAREIGDKLWIACGLQMVGIQLGGTYRHSEVLDHFQQASAIFAGLHDYRRKAETDLLLANTHIVMGNVVQAQTILLQCLEMFKQLELPFWIIHTLCSMGDICGQIGNHSEGAGYYRQAISVAVNSNLPRELGILYHHASSAYRKMEDHKQAMVYLFKSLSIHRYNRDIGGMAVTMSGIADNYISQGYFLRAEKYIRQAGRLYRKLRYVALEAQAWGRLGLIYVHKGEMKQASRCFKKGITLAHSCEDQSAIGALYLHYGEFCVQAGWPNRGISYLKSAIRIIAKLADRFHLYRAYEKLADAYQAVGDVERGLKYYKISQRIKTSYINSQKILEVSYAEMSERIRTLKDKLKAEQAMRKNLAKIVEEKESELLSLTRQLILKNNRKEESNSFKQQEGRLPEGTWEIFANQFHKVHHSFYGKLVNTFPQLTPTEVKVSSLIRIGLSTKEIADILCISKRTVDTHRVRIHKKMNLPQGTSLTNFITRL